MDNVDDFLELIKPLLEIFLWSALDSLTDIVILQSAHCPGDSWLGTTMFPAIKFVFEVRRCLTATQH